MWITVFFSLWLGNLISVDCSPIEQYIATKIQSVENKDEQLYLSTIAISDSMYRQEQKRWIQDAIRWIEPGSFQLRIDRKKRLDHNRYLLWVQQSYQMNGEKKRLTFPQVVQCQDNRWKDADYPFYSKQKGSIRLKYTDASLQTQAQEVLETADRAWNHMRRRFPQFQEPIQIKLYHSPQWFYQSVKPSLPKWAGGWNEAGESIKLLAIESDKNFLHTAVIHELTHQVVGTLTNDNASYWLQEGAAMYYERDLSKQKQTDPTPPFYSLSELENKRLEQLSDQEAWRYYQSCLYLYTKLINQYGEEKIEQVFQALRQYPLIDANSDLKMKITNERTKKALIKELGKKSLLSL